jgi:hypothetical protein
MAWSHVYLQSGNRIPAQIQLDFEKSQREVSSDKPAMITETNDPWVNVTRPGLGPNDKVRLVMTTTDSFEGNSNNGYKNWQINTPQIVDLQYAGGERFTAPLQSMTLGSQTYGGNDTTRERVSVVINGEWQRDPLNGTNDFNVDMSNAYTEPE